MEELLEPYLNTFALVLLCVIGISSVYVIIYIHDIPYEIAKKRKHPHLEAIHIAGWISLVFMHALWPLLWIWAYLFTTKIENEKISEAFDKEELDIKQLREQVNELKQELTLLSDQIKNSNTSKE